MKTRRWWYHSLSNQIYAIINQGEKTLFLVGRTRMVKKHTSQIAPFVKSERNKWHAQSWTWHQNYLLHFAETDWSLCRDWLVTNEKHILFSGQTPDYDCQWKNMSSIKSTFVKINDHKLAANVFSKKFWLLLKWLWKLPRERICKRNYRSSRCSWQHNL